MGNISDKNTKILITIPKDLKEWVQDKARREHRSMSNYIIDLLMWEREKDEESFH